MVYQAASTQERRKNGDMLALSPVLQKEKSCQSIVSSEAAVAPAEPEKETEQISVESDDSLSTSKEVPIICPKKGAQKEKATVTDNNSFYESLYL